MKKIVLILSFFVYFVTLGQTPSLPVTSVNNLKINNPVLGTTADSVLVYRGSDKIVRFIPASDIGGSGSQDIQSVLTEGNTYSSGGYELQLNSSGVSVLGTGGEFTSYEWDKISYSTTGAFSTNLRFEETIASGELTIPNKTGTLATLDDIVAPNLDEVTTVGNETSNGISVGGVGINTTTPEAVLDVVSTESGVLIPRLTESERDAIATPINSMLIFNSDSEVFEYYLNSSWVAIGGGSVPTMNQVLESGNTVDNGYMLQFDQYSGSYTSYIGGIGIGIGDFDNNSVQLQATNIQFSGGGSATFGSTVADGAFLSLSDGSNGIYRTPTSLVRNFTGSGLQTTIEYETATDVGTLIIPNVDDNTETFATREWVATNSGTPGLVFTDTVDGFEIGTADHTLISEGDITLEGGSGLSHDFPTTSGRLTNEDWVESQFGKLISLTNTAILALTPEIGRLYYNTTINEIVYHNGTTWKKITNTDM